LGAVDRDTVVVEPADAGGELPPHDAIVKAPHRMSPVAAPGALAPDDSGCHQRRTGGTVFSFPRLK
jgi:hypothetical protein